MVIKVKLGLHAACEAKFGYVFSEKISKRVRKNRSQAMSSVKCQNFFPEKNIKISDDKIWLKRHRVHPNGHNRRKKKFFCKELLRISQDCLLIRNIGKKGN